MLSNLSDNIYTTGNFTPPPIYVILACFICYALFYIRGHSYLPLLTRHYVLYLISTFTETMPRQMAPTRECTHLTTSQFEPWTIFFRHFQASRHIFINVKVGNPKPPKRYFPTRTVLRKVIQVVLF